MHRALAIVTLLVIAAIPRVSTAKGELIRIEISSPDLSPPIEVTDADALDRLAVWSGPGAGQPIGSPWDSQSGAFINWELGIQDSVPTVTEVYDVAFFCRFHQDESAQLAYFVKYAYDAATGHGYIYLPGRKEKYYDLNTSSIFHNIEGHWFASSPLWESLIASRIREQSQTAQVIAR